MDPTGTNLGPARPGAGSAALALPEFGAFLRQLREQAAPRPDHRRDGGRVAGMSRAELAGAVGCSISYLVKLEQGAIRSPTGAVIDAVADVLCVTAAQRRHLHDLSRHGLGTPRPGTTRPVGTPVTAANRAYVDNLAPALSAFVDEAWNVVYANEPYTRIYRHITDPAINNVLLWFFFVDASRRIMVEWEREARLTVAWLRGLLAEQTTSPTGDCAGLLERLSRSVEFRTMWDEGAVALARHKEEMLVRDLDHGTLLHLRAQVLRWPEPGTALQLYLGVAVTPAPDHDPDPGPAHGSAAAVPESQP